MGRTFPDWQGAVKRHLSVRWMGSYPKKVEKPEACEECGERFVFVTGLDKLGAEELAGLGPQAVLDEYWRRKDDKARGSRWGPAPAAVGAPELPRGKTAAEWGLA
jgi:hypothetical protein